VVDAARGVRQLDIGGFHAKVPDHFIERVFEVMASTPRHSG
jgi:protein gp37